MRSFNFSITYFYFSFILVSIDLNLLSPASIWLLCKVPLWNMAAVPVKDAKHFHFINYIWVTKLTKKMKEDKFHILVLLSNLS